MNDILILKSILGLGVATLVYYLTTTGITKYLEYKQRTNTQKYFRTKKR